MVKYLLITRIIGLLIFIYDIFIDKYTRINWKKALANKENKIILICAVTNCFLFNVILAEFEIISIILNVLHFLIQIILKVIEKIGTLYFSYNEFQITFGNKLCKKLIKKYGDKNENAN